MLVSELSDKIDELRKAALFETDEMDHLTPFAEQSFLKALAHLELAQREAKTADYQWMQKL